MADGVGTFFAEGEIVLGSAAGIGMTSDDDLGIGIIAEVVGQLVEFRPLFSFDGEAIVGEENGFAFESVVVCGVGVTRTLGEGLVVNIVGAVSEGRTISLFIFVGAPRKDGEKGEK